MSDKYVPKNSKTKREYKTAVREAKSLSKKSPMDSGSHELFKENKKVASDYRMSRREDKRAKTRSPSVKTKHSRITDNRPEVAKGSKASGVTVNNKLVRQGRVKAAEKVTAQGLFNKAGRTASRGHRLVAIAANSAALGKATGKGIRKAVDSYKSASGRADIDYSSFSNSVQGKPTKSESYMASEIKQKAKHRGK